MNSTNSTNREKIIFKSALLAYVALANITQADDKPDPRLSEQWTPVPAIVTPGKIPSDAIILFNGDNLDAWETNGEAPKWQVSGDVVSINPKSGGLRSKQSFCDIQLHLEWRSPPKVAGKKGQKLGNSGIYFQGRYEVQILDSYENMTYVNGQAASIYKQSAPLVNAMLPPGEWNTFDIIYTAPTFNKDESLKTPAYLTVLHNGILVQNHFELEGHTDFWGQPKYKAHGCAPIYIQDHNDRVSFRNIWVREL